MNLRLFCFDELANDLIEFKKINIENWQNKETKRDAVKMRQNSVAVTERKDSLVHCAVTEIL